MAITNTNAITSDKADVDHILQTIHEEILQYAEKLKQISMYMFENPELAFKEVKAHDCLVEFLKQEGFEVDEHFHLATSFKATFKHGEGGHTFGLNSELDALPGIGHGVASLLGLRKAMLQYNIAGRVILLGTPAEETGGGKLKLLQANAYEGMDVCMMVHPGQSQVGQASISPTLAVQSFEVEFHGKPAHAAGAPWDGINALDAATMAYASINAMRQQLHPSDRVHGIILNGGEAPNIIPKFTSMKYFLRATTAAGMERVKEKVMPCFEAAALATGCTHSVKFNDLLTDIRNCKPIGELFSETMATMFNIHTVQRYHDWSGGGLSTDFGNVTYAMPSCHPFYGIPCDPKRMNHTAEFEQNARGDKSHEETWKVATGMAAVGLKLFRDPSFSKEAREWWEKDMRGDFMP
ncbi:hypothetical protein I307_06361 [Cryptococcus deuterogattii 99/473]|nr:hypothetical protein I309_06318 [Cryptococcus deuterogattii LA55]KIR75307.1 hypothetical protein I310_01586 [Cryptococcus deuterogattii CA1014]KIR92976.1 hypothetical protein I304_03558 [Cryptococcus deuterogattii CBS 10090]KIY54302.1 hypothetical protein I307_06361 [Cryptococcus deuterogattii 99/473]